MLWRDLRPGGLLARRGVLARRLLRWPLLLPRCAVAGPPKTRRRRTIASVAARRWVVHAHRRSPTIIRTRLISPDDLASADAKRAPPAWSQISYPLPTIFSSR